MQDSILIYVAGNPELYPLEYYDADTESYQGAIPALLADFAASHGYEIVYYEPGRADNRAGLAEKMQVDVISGVVSGESFENTAGTLTLFAADGDGGTAEYGLAFTSTAPESFIGELSAYAVERSTADVTAELLASSAGEPARDEYLLPVTAGLGAALCLAVCALIAVLRRGSKRRRAADLERRIDPCTGLLNQFGLERAFRETVNEDNRALYYMLCFHFELGHIERVSGPGEIPRFQRFAADVLRRRAGNGEIMARGNNGDFFVLRRDTGADAARGWALGALGEIRTYTYSGAQLSGRDASAGVYPLAAKQHDYEQILYHARQCAMAAGREDLNAKICGAEQCHICEEERELLADLEHGLEYGEFQLHIQFFVSAEDFSITGGEALSRWQHPRRGLLGPDRFIPLLEREGRIDRLDLYNLDKACAFLQRLRDLRGGNYFYISCNFSRLSFSRPELADRCREIIERYDFPRSELIIEITESGLISPNAAEQMSANLAAIRALGVQVMFDDFGMGYSTFHDLQDFPMDGLKLDKSLVDNLGTERGRVIADGIIRTGHRLGLAVLAEGVEQEWQVDELKKLHCDLLQGYLFSVPIPAGEAMERVSGPR